MVDSVQRTRAKLASYREWSREHGEGHGNSACAIINADDWGRSAATTDRTLDCIRFGSVTAASGMVFMADSERAAGIASAGGLDVGLHLNLTTPFSAGRLPARLSEHLDAVASYLRRSRLNRYIYHPGLTNSFHDLIAWQFEEYFRLYREDAQRVDGHHHMHLCANVTLGGLLPAGVVIRRNFTFSRGERNPVNRSLRRCYDFWLSRRYRMVDALVELAPIQPVTRVAGVFSRACRESVEIETHPVNVSEYQFLVGDALSELADVRRQRAGQSPA